MGNVVVVYKLRQIAVFEPIFVPHILMLVMKVLAEFGPVDRIPRGLSSPASECAERKWARIRRSAEVCRLRLRCPCGAAECGDAGVIGGGAGSSGERAYPDQRPGE